MADYTKMKNAELENLLKDRGLPHTGKKAELVARLTEDDKTKKSAAPAPTAGAQSSKAEDDITWDEDEEAATSTSAAAALAAGGTERVKNPTVVPNQAPAIDPSKTSDLAASKPASTATPSVATGPSSTDANTATAAPAIPKQDFTSGLPSTDVDVELEKRKKRLAKFGNLDADASTANNGAAEDSEAAKAAARAARFGLQDPAEAARSSAISRLDGALPEEPQRRGKKRGSDAMLDDGTASALDDPGLKRSRGGRGRRGGGAESGARPEAKREGAPSWMSEADKAKADARKNRWTVPTSS